MNTEELWQAYDENGKPIPGKGLTRDDAHSGKLHGSSHLWIWRKTDHGIEILLQKRAETKFTWPGYYDISAAGHIDLGETPEQTALREAQEEIGDVVSGSEITLLFVYRQHMVEQRNGVIENEFQHIFGLILDKDVSFVLDRQEVERVKWVDLDTFERMIDQKTTDQLVPQGAPYFDELLSHIRKT